MAMVELQKRPVAWRVKDFADGWIIFQSEENAQAAARRTGALCQGLYVRVGDGPTRDEVRKALFGKNPEVERTLMANRVANAAREEQVGWRDRKVDGPYNADAMAALKAVDNMWTNTGSDYNKTVKEDQQPFASVWTLVRRALGYLACDGCHRGLEDDWLYCPTCGRQIEPRAA